MQENQTIILSRYLAFFIFRKWSLIIIISLDLLMIFHSTFYLINRIRLLDDENNIDFNGNNNQYQHYHYRLLNDDDEYNNNDKLLNQTTTIFNKSNNVFNYLMSSYLFNNDNIILNNNDKQLSTTTTTTMSSIEMDPLLLNLQNDNDNENIYEIGSMTKKSLLWHEMFDENYHLHKRPRILSQIIINLFSYVICLIGLIGIIKENYFLTLIYIWFVCFSLTSTLILYMWTLSTELFGRIFTNLLFIILLFMYLKDLAIIRLQIIDDDSISPDNNNNNIIDNNNIVIVA